MRSITLTLAILLVGCATPQWRADYADPQFKRDDYVCTFDSQSGAAADRPVQSWLAGYKSVRQLYVQCMEAKGYARRD